MLALLFFLLAASPVAKQVDAVRAQVTAIDADATLVKSEGVRKGDTQETAKAEIWRQNKAVRKIVTTFKENEERVYFAPDGVTPIFLFVSAEGVEFRYWFKDGKVVRMVGADKKKVEGIEALEGANDEAAEMVTRALESAQ